LFCINNVITPSVFNVSRMTLTMSGPDRLQEKLQMFCTRAVYNSKDVLTSVRLFLTSTHYFLTGKGRGEGKRKGRRSILLGEKIFQESRTTYGVI